jgi:hypothetical protein
MRRKPNDDIREAAKQAEVKLWEIAEEMGTTHTAFSILLRHELTGAKKATVLKSIEMIEMRHRNETVAETTDGN